MKTQITTLTAIAIGCLLQSSASAFIVLHEGFDYPDGTSIAGLSGGDGWRNAWSINENITSATVQGGNLVIGDGKTSPLVDASKTAAVSRRIQDFDGLTVFIKYTFSLGAGTSADPDRFYLSLWGRGAENGWGNLEVGTGLANGQHSNTAAAKPDTQITARAFSTVANRVVNDAISIGDQKTYTVIVELDKTGADSYNTLRLWINPTAADYAVAFPQKLTYQHTLGAISSFSIFIDEVESGDVFKISDITLGTTWDDVTGSPTASKH